MVFCIEPVGTLTACTMNVIPNKAIMTVTTADSKYSRITLLGGPTGSASTFVSTSRPLDLTGREENALGFSVVFSSVVTVDSFIANIVEVGKLDGQASFRWGLLAVHLFQRCPCSGGLGRLNRWTLTPRDAAVPPEFDMDHTPVRRTQRFDYGVLWSRLMNRLQFLLQSSFRICRSGGDRIGRAQLWAERKFDEVFRRLQSTVEEDRSGYCFENIRQQSMLSASTTLLFATAKPHEFAQSQIRRRLCQGWLADQPVFHAGQFTFAR